MSVTKLYAIVGGALLAIILLMGSLFTVDEGDKAIILTLGKIQTSADGSSTIKSPGLHFKYPLISTVQIFNARLQTLDIKSSRIMTAEKKEVVVDYFVKWRIQDFAKYYTRTGGYTDQAARLLEQQLNDGLRAEFGKRTIQDVVAESRSQIMETLRERANQAAKELGVIIVDVRIKGIDLPKEVSMAVYQRMRVERERVASEHRAEGKAKGEAIRADADAKVAVILATATASGAQVRAEGDAKAAQIYREAYGKDKEFFEFYRSLEAYRQAFNQKQDVLILSPDSEFFRYFQHAKKSN